jgi:hypothetical protein
MRSAGVVSILAAGLLIAGSGFVTRPGHAQGARMLYDFEDGEQGFAPISVKDNQLEVDPSATVSVTKDKAQIKSGAGSLVYSFKVEPKVFRALVAEAKLPPETQALQLWVRSAAQTILMLTLREEDGSSYQLPFHIPAHQWTQVAANLDELELGDNEKDENNKLDLNQVAHVGLIDIANVLVNAGEAAGAALPDFKGARQLWLDDLRFSKERVPQAAGLVKTDAGSSYLVDNFEAGVVRWTPVRLVFVNNPMFDLFPENSTLKISADAAAPGMAKTPVEPGGKGLRFSYKRGEKEAFALVRSVERADLGRAERLRLSLNCTQKSLLVVQVKEKDGSEYQHLILPDDSVGWRNLDLRLSGLTLSESSKDENNALDPGQIKEITLVDGSAFLGGLTGDAAVEIDAVSFTLK